MIDSDNRICFAIQAHHEPDLCERLVRVLCREGDAVILHVNKKEKEYRKELVGMTCSPI